MSSPVIQIYDMSDGEAQELVLGLLQDWQGVAARSAFSGPDRYIVIECARFRTRTVHLHHGDLRRSHRNLDPLDQWPCTTVR